MDQILIFTKTIDQQVDNDTQQITVQNGRFYITKDYLLDLYSNIKSADNKSADGAFDIDLSCSIDHNFRGKVCAYLTAELFDSLTGDESTVTLLLYDDEGDDLINVFDNKMEISFTNCDVKNKMTVDFDLDSRVCTAFEVGLTHLKHRMEEFDRKFVSEFCRSNSMGEEEYTYNCIIGQKYSATVVDCDEAFTISSLDDDDNPTDSIIIPMDYLFVISDVFKTFFKDDSPGIKPERSHGLKISKYSLKNVLMNIILNLSLDGINYDKFTSQDYLKIILFISEYSIDVCYSKLLSILPKIKISDDEISYFITLMIPDQLYSKIVEYFITIGKLKFIQKILLEDNNSSLSKTILNILIKNN